jgi:hypothetical protein
VISPRAALLCIGLGAMFAAASGCAGGGSSGIVVATPVPSGSVSPTPAPCGTPVTNAVYVAMASYITARVDSTYGLIDGYAIVLTDGTYSNVAEPIMVKPGDTVQFVNVEPAPSASQGPIQHSAVSLLGATFPPSPVATATATATATASASASATPVPGSTLFPSTAQAPIGTAISNLLWSTGRVDASSTDTLCYSQSFSTPTQGTYAFGDYDYYFLTNMRDVIVVTSAATQSMHQALPAGTIRRAPSYFPKF